MRRPIDSRPARAGWVPRIAGAAFACAWAVSARAQGAGRLELIPPASPGTPLQGRATVPAGTEWVVVFYRTEGETEFSSFNLEAGPDGTFAGTPELPIPAGAKLEYYAALRTPGGLQYLPKEAPGVFATLQLPGGTAAGMAGPATAGAPPTPAGSAPAAAGAAPAPPLQVGGLPGPLHLDANLERVAHHQQSVPGEVRNLASGQLRFTYQADEGDHHLFTNARLVYTNQPIGAQTRWSLGEFQTAYATGRQKLQVGDMMVQESEFTLAGAGRRGFDYLYAGQPLAAHLFALNTQAQSGTRGIFWPVAGSEVYGGSLGFGWRNDALRAKVVFLSGKDDPATALNLATTYAAAVREGSTGALVLDGRLLDSRLTLSGEYARSLYTKDVAEAPVKQSDQAWRVSGLWNQGAFSAHAGYREVGRDFGTVGVVFFVGDRRVADGSLAYNAQAWSLSFTATDERTNPTGQPGQPQAWNRTQGLDARLGLTQTLFWRVGFRLARQEAEVVANPLIPFSNSRRSGLSTGFDFALPPASSLSFNAQFDRLRSEGGIEVVGSSTTLSFGGSVMAGERLRLSPNLSWSRTLNDPGDQKTTVSNAFLNADFTLVPGYLGFLLNGGVFRTVAPSGQSQDNAVAEGTLRFFFDPYLKGRGRASLGVKGRYTRTPAPFTGAPPTGATVSDSQASILLNVSF